MSSRYSGIGPIICAHLLRTVDEKLIELLRSLASNDWDMQTVAPKWKVRDVAAHLLDTVLRKLSMARDSWFVEAVESRSRRDVCDLVNRLNAEGVAVYRRLSPPVLIELMKVVCDQSARFHESLDPFGPAMVAVNWAGEEKSLNWFDTARELTERWHHQQQIRLATNRPGIMTPDLYHPVLDCFLRALPYHYKDVDRPPGVTLLLEVSGDCGGQWCLARGDNAWALADELRSEPTASVTVPQEIAWRVFTRGIDHESAKGQIRMTGDHVLCDRILELTAVVA